ncbi:MAG: response regulator transcription factor, partial [Lachnospira sp.]
MRILIVEDDFASRKFMMNFMSAYGDCDGTVDGMEAVEAYMMALEDEQPYDLICLDVMMPVMDGYQVLNTIRNMEKQRGIEGDDRVKIIMMTALNEQKNVRKAFEMGCTVY